MLKLSLKSILVTKSTTLLLSQVSAQAIVKTRLN